MYVSIPAQVFYLHRPIFVLFVASLSSSSSSLTVLDLSASLGVLLPASQRTPKGQNRDSVETE